MLAWTIYLSFAGALLQALLPKGKAELSRWLALGFAVAGLALAVA
jgi:NADH-quinone oxidoreductase subunit M